MYQSLLRPLLFRRDAEKIHQDIVKLVASLRRMSPLRPLVRACFDYQGGTPFSWQGLTFRNRVGLSAGFDKGAECFDELADFGFALIEVGTITPAPVAGNPQPRIFRLPKDEALISRTGFNNPGIEMAAIRLQRLGRHRQRYVLGVNINTNHPDQPAEAVADITRLCTTLADKADYFTLNWGSMPPETLLAALRACRAQKEARPVVIKLPADLPLEKLPDIVSRLLEDGANGFIATGPTQDRSTLTHATPEELEHIGAGGVSGHPVLAKSLAMMRRLSQLVPEGCLLIGAGGVMTPEDALQMQQAGAQLVQLYSAFIYQGPTIVRRMARQLNRK